MSRKETASEAASPKKGAARAKKASSGASIKRPPEQKRRGRGRLLPALLIALILLGGLLGWMHLQARVVHLRRAEVYLSDLPAGMDGATALFLSDFNLRSASDARACERLMKKLSQTEPDLLLLGGDYSAPGLLDLLNGADGGDAAAARAFISSLSGFEAPLGKYAVLGERDDTSLAGIFSEAGIECLIDAPAVLERNGGRVVLAGLSDASLGQAPYGQIGRSYAADDCVLVLAHNPAAYVDIRVNEARSGGAWADLVLCGHTLGGQIRLFGRTLRSYPPEVVRCIGGWYYIDDLPMLVTTGVGCEGAALRLGTQSEAWLLTLRRA